MKKLLFFLLFVSFEAYAQNYKQSDNFFNNSNGELSLILYSKTDELGSYLIYMVMEDLQPNDIEIIDQWNKFSKNDHFIVINRWIHNGKRIEVLRPGTNGEYCIFPPKFPKSLKKPILLLQPAPVSPSVDPWNLEIKKTIF